MSTKRYEYNLKFAFTMAEAVLVMTILGIIATVMITIMKPAKFKDQGYEVLAKSIYASIDSAVSLILSDKSPINKMSSIYKADNSETFSMLDNKNGAYFIELLKLYMVTARGKIPNVCKNQKYDGSMLLKNGACIAVKSGLYANQYKEKVIVPGETVVQDENATHGMLFLDTNGDVEPNTLGKDQWKIPFDRNGIKGNDSTGWFRDCCESCMESYPGCTGDDTDYLSCQNESYMQSYRSCISRCNSALSIEIPF